MNRRMLIIAALGGAGLFGALIASAAVPQKDVDAEIARSAQSMLEEGRKTFRYETFGSEAFWGDALQLHKAIAGEKNGGTGPGVSPKTALSVGLKVDADALPGGLRKQLAAGKVNLDDPATTQMHGAATFFDARLNNNDQYPVAAKSGSWNTRNTPDKTTAKLAALHFYQLSIPAPKAPAGSFDHAAFERGKTVFNGPGQCASCHVPPLYTEPGQNLHPPSEIGIDSFQADRSPTHMYRTAPLAGLWTHQKGGFFHDGRFATLLDVVNHYNTQFKLNLSKSQEADLVEYLKGI